jgi:hypothetical protein
MSQPLETTPTEAVDFLGHQIIAGDLVVYPVRRGSDMWMNKLRVDSVRDTPRGKAISGTNDAGRRIIVRNLTNCTVISEPK